MTTPSLGPGVAPPFDQPYYGAPFAAAFLRFWKKGTTFTGRASSSEYWLSWLASVGTVVALWIMSLVFSTIGMSSGSSAIAGFGGFLSILALLWALACILPSIAVAVRRLHDTGQPGVMYLLCLIPFVGGIILLVYLCQPAKASGVRFDAPPSMQGGPAGYAPVPPPAAHAPAVVPPARVDAATAAVPPVPPPPPAPAAAPHSGFAGVPPVPPPPAPAVAAPATPARQAAPFVAPAVLAPEPSVIAPAVPVPPVADPPAPSVASSPAPPPSIAAPAPTAAAPITGVPGLGRPAASSAPSAVYPAHAIGDDERDATRLVAPPVGDDLDATRMSAPLAAAAWVVELPDGRRIPITGPVYFGRSPLSPDGGTDAVLVPIDDPARSMSKTHARLGVAGSGVEVTDLHSSNGTTVTVPGQPRLSLTPGVPRTIDAGAAIAFGDYTVHLQPAG